MVTIGDITSSDLERALVTGATGFLGGHLCKNLVKRGVPVRGTVRTKGAPVDSLETSGVQIVQAELTNLESLEDAMRGVEVVFHVAALASYVAPRAVIEAANVLGSHNVLTAARRCGVRRVVYVSSESVTLRDADRINEDEAEPFPKRFLDHYSRTKAQAESEMIAANNRGIETVAVRPPWIWGEGDTSVLKAIALSMLNGKYAFVSSGQNRITTCHVENVCSGLMAAAVSPNAPSRVYHVADDLRPTIHDFLSRLCEAAGIAVTRRHVPYRPAYLAAYVADLMRRIGLRAPIMLSRPYVIHTGRTWTLDDGRIHRELGYQPKVTMDEGFERLGVWVQACGGIKAALGRRPSS
ncbi:MAG: NAD-dependent epimerase/dehydratase family protein [Desulfobacteraceae bacterium]|jgi:nucleoside-diphosphate-sugar epimerase